MKWTLELIIAFTVSVLIIAYVLVEYFTAYIVAGAIMCCIYEGLKHRHRAKIQSDNIIPLENYNESKGESGL